MQGVAWHSNSQRWNSSAKHASPDAQMSRRPDHVEKSPENFADDVGQSPVEGRYSSKVLVSPLNGFSERLIKRPHSAASTPRRLHYGYDNAIFGAVQRQIEALETRVAQQISRAQQEGDEQVNAALERLEEQRIASESLEPRLGRRFAEVHGQVKGIVEELQSLIIRTNALDSRFWDWRHELDDGMQQQLSALQKQLEALASDREADKSIAEEVRHELDDGTQQQLSSLQKQLEALASDRDSDKSLAEEVWHNVEQRLQTAERFLEDHVLIAEQRGAQQKEVLQTTQDEALSDAGAVWKSEQRWAETTRRFDAFQEEVNSSEARMKAHDVRMNLVLERLEGLDRRYQALSDRTETQSIEEHIGQFHKASEDIVELSLKVDKYAEEMIELASFVYSREDSSLESPKQIAPSRPKTHHLPLVVSSGRQNDEQVCESSDAVASFKAPLGVLTTRLDEAVAKVEEHDRCTRVLLCDVLPRVGELSDARDQVRDALATMEERIAAAEANMQWLQSSTQETW